MRLPPELDLKTSLPALLDLVLPRVCVVCGRALMPCEKHICLLCAEDLPRTRFAELSHNPMAEKFNAGMSPDVYEPYAYAAALFHYSAGSGYDNITKALKYGGNLAEGRYFAAFLVITVGANALYGIYQPWLYSTLGEAIGGLIAAFLQCCIAFWVFFPIMKLIFLSQKKA